MDKEYILLNVKLPFIESVEYLKNDKEVVACQCDSIKEPCTMMLTQTNRLQFFSNSIFEQTRRPFIGKLITIDNILKNNWFLVVKKRHNR